MNWIKKKIEHRRFETRRKISRTLKYEIVYNYKYQINKADTLNIQTESMVLKIGKHLSEYVSYNKILVKEKLKEMSESGNVDMRNVPKARILYASATGVSEVQNFGYMSRLALWGSERSSVAKNFLEFQGLRIDLRSTQMRCLRLRYFFPRRLCFKIFLPVHHYLLTSTVTS